MPALTPITNQIPFYAHQSASPVGMAGSSLGAGNLAGAVSTAGTGNPVEVGKTGEAGSASAAEKVAFGGCETCKNRKYVDVSSESDVSFQSPGHISPSASASVVGSHEREHVANAVQKAKEPGAKLVSATVRLITSTCPECGRRYVAGGVTNTLIQYSKNPYSQAKKSLDGGLLAGSNVDMKL